MSYPEDFGAYLRQLNQNESSYHEEYVKYKDIIEHNLNQMTQVVLKYDYKSYVLGYFSTPLHIMNKVVAKLNLEKYRGLQYEIQHNEDTVSVVCKW